jgi:hypothetical protein
LICFSLAVNYIHIKIKKGKTGDNYVVTRGEYGAVGFFAFATLRVSQNPIAASLCFYTGTGTTPEF